MLQAQSTPRAYLIAEVQVTDSEAYKPYIPKAAQIVAQFGTKKSCQEPFLQRGAGRGNGGRGWAAATEA
jgi:uncharacterized protein (DUF1330 family)